MKNIKIIILTMFVASFSFAQTITTFPYFTGFEGIDGNTHTNFPAGWSYEDLNVSQMGNQSWQIIKNSPVAQNSRTDSTAIHSFSHPSESNNDWIYTPGVQMESGVTYTLTFWYSSRRYGSTIEKLKIHIGKDTVSTAMSATPIYTNDNITNEVYAQATVNYTATESDLFYFGFHSYSDAFMYITYIDDVTISNDVTGISGSADNFDAKIGPNPCTNYVEISGLNNTTNYNVEVYNTLGQLLNTKNFTGESYKLNTSNLAVGNYFLRILSKEKNSIISKQISVRR